MKQAQYNKFYILARNSDKGSFKTLFLHILCLVIIIRLLHINFELFNTVKNTSQFNATVINSLWHIEFIRHYKDMQYVSKSFILQIINVQEIFTSINSAAISMNNLSTFSASFADVSK